VIAGKKKQKQFERAGRKRALNASMDRFMEKEDIHRLIRGKSLP